MAVIDRFLGRSVEVPEDRLYDARQGFWARRDGDEVVFGLSEPALAQLHGLHDVEWLTPEGRRVEKGEAVVFAITGKILYLDAPSAGTIRFNPELKRSPSLAAQDPYGRGWFFRIRPVIGPGDALRNFMAAADYVETLRYSEGVRNSQGLKSGKTGMCHAVYKGIRHGLTGSCC
jgi:glycine cleavage system H protein